MCLQAAPTPPLSPTPCRLLCYKRMKLNLSACQSWAFPLTCFVPIVGNLQPACNLSQPPLPSFPLPLVYTNSCVSHFGTFSCCQCRVEQRLLRPCLFFFCACCPLLIVGRLVDGFLYLSSFSCVPSSISISPCLSSFTSFCSASLLRVVSFALFDCAFNVNLPNWVAPRQMSCWS